jgi:uncharacterized protein
MADPRDLETELMRIVSGSRWCMRVLRTVRGLGLADWCVGAGVLRNMVWDILHDYTTPSPLADIDVAYFDPINVQPERDRAIERQLARACPHEPWEVTNQAGVHLWFADYFGHAVEPLHSLAEAVATWPETATAVAVTLTATDSIEVIAPLGLQDLFDMVVRRNPRRVSIETYRQRLVQKRYAERWPKVRLVDA